IRYGLVFILKKDDKIISIIEYMQKFQEKKVFLYGISTLKEYRHQGYAKFLLRESEKYLKELNFEEIELTVDPANKIAIDFYLKESYTKEKFLKDEYGKNIDRFVMKKII
nr:GNAT family N-acetyltransferase [Fusobacterium sp.]